VKIDGAVIKSYRAAAKWMKHHMGNESLLVMILVGGVAGWLAGLVMRGSGYGIIGDVIVGLLGALVGTWLMRAFNLSVNLGSLRERAGDVWRR
jgi:uncharacterized membrane protein YeaQ/YmgE (transglycosylase-associated protein family)